MSARVCSGCLCRFGVAACLVLRRRGSERVRRGTEGPDSDGWGGSRFQGFGVGSLAEGAVQHNVFSSYCVAGRVAQGVGWAHGAIYGGRADRRQSGPASPMLARMDTGCCVLHSATAHDPRSAPVCATARMHRSCPVRIRLAAQTAPPVQLMLTLLNRRATRGSEDDSIAGLTLDGWCGVKGGGCGARRGRNGAQMGPAGGLPGKKIPLTAIWARHGRQRGSLAGLPSPDAR